MLGVEGYQSIWECEVTVTVGLGSNKGGFILHGGWLVWLGQDRVLRCFSDMCKGLRHNKTRIIFVVWVGRVTGSVHSFCKKNEGCLCYLVRAPGLSG